MYRVIGIKESSRFNRLYNEYSKAIMAVLQLERMGFKVSVIH